MQGGQEGHAGASQQRITEVINVTVDHVKFLGAARHRFQQDHVRRQIIGDRGVEP